MMQNGFICESANIENLDPAMADMPIVRERQDNVKLGCVLSNSFGFGGTNASVVFKRWTCEPAISCVSAGLGLVRCKKSKRSFDAGADAR